jgi:hypothetical protein
MIAVCSIGDCEILILRRGGDGYLAPVFHTEMQRIDGNAQSPLQLARVDDSVDPDFDPSIAVEVIERGSAVHCVSAFEGDIVVLGSDGVFDNLFIDEIVMLIQGMMGQPEPGKKFKALDRHRLGAMAKRLVLESHSKTQIGPGGYRPSPIGPGGKIDDTSCVVAQVVEWTDAHGEAWADVRAQRSWRSLFTCGGNIPSCEDDATTDYIDIDDDTGTRQRNYPSKPNANSFSTYWGSFSEYQTTGGPPPRRSPQPLPSLREQRESENGCQIM